VSFEHAYTKYTGSLKAIYILFIYMCTVHCTLFLRPCHDPCRSLRPHFETRSILRQITLTHARTHTHTHASACTQAYPHPHSTLAHERAHTHARAHVQTTYARAHAHVHTRTHTSVHTYSTHTRTHTRVHTHTSTRTVTHIQIGFRVLKLNVKRVMRMFRFPPPPPFTRKF
jgi:hypothetical protein